MSARAFASIPKQFFRSVRFQKANFAKMGSKQWNNGEFMFQELKEINRSPFMTSRNMRSFMNKMHCAEMQKIQIGALYMFSYVTKEFLEMIKHYEELLDELEAKTDEDQTTLTGRSTV